ncbi:DNA polymerase II large subunit [Halocatena pleomorpha]|uniref:DNA polymerase II large subunit n=1 Tax=Halocatena pleomorpha TaxID=1785090 RepID=A0A3P3R910_9EURY|nr:DNA polymerase II large subunit [Halocatena pleomorpha]RRJ29140.1 DNA polymerase II large subunit [Halocatena pleomorpha]
MSAEERYFEQIEARLDEAFSVARSAKERGGDPSTEVEIPVAKDMADRVENILGIEGVAQRVRELEGEMSREEAALALAEDFAEERVGDYETTAGKIEGAVRTAVALLTEGVVAAPIEGIDRVEVLENDDGSRFVRVFYAGPIRSAGGTAQALSVLVADYARTLLGLDRYKPREEEVERYAEELGLYDNETGLQYSPKDKETTFIAEHCPIMLDGEATGETEVSATRDLERVDTNNPRGGMCLVLGEGIAQKAPKIKRYTGQLAELEWPWLDDLIEGTIGTDSDDGSDTDTETDTDGDADSQTSAVEDASASESGPPRAEQTTKFLRDLIAGRPVFSHPSRTGGFRLRYGRARNHGFATAGVHPATMHLVDDFLATGTQIKTERPGKAAGVVPVDTIEGPTVRLANGEVRRIDDPEEAKEIRNGVEAILDLGEYLVNYGEFVENNHPLAPASYTVEWWVQEFERAGGDVQALRDDPHVDLAAPPVTRALAWATDEVPLHPEYTYLWHDLTVGQFDELADAVSAGRVSETDDTLVVPRTESTRTALETLLVEHTTDEEITIPDASALIHSLGLTPDLEREWSLNDLSETARSWGESAGSNAIKAVNEVAPFSVRERAPTRVGNRMGRPEKSEKRELSPAVHTLFPIGESGGSQRDVAQAAAHTESMRSTAGEVELTIARRECVDCGTTTFTARCPDCGGVTEPVYVCRDCDIRVEPDESGRAECPRCEELATPVENRTVDLNEAYHEALSAVGEREHAFEILKGVKGLTSEQKVPEPMEKGVLRAKHDVSAFKDGTIRYDMTDLPVTAVRPAELDVTVEQFRELGYETDIDGAALRHDDQLVELRVQDIVLSSGAAEHMLKTADFVDDLLERYYGMEPFYDVDDRDELVGELVFGMAPHTSAAVVGRVVGFTDAAVGYAHPYFHAAKRRNCDGDEDCVMLLMDGLLNFSKLYLPDKRGGSVTADTRLTAFDPAGELQTLPIEELWTELDCPIEYDGKFEKKSCLGEGWTTYAFDEHHETTPQPIEKAIRYRVEDEQLLQVKTQFGRSVTITDNHSLFRYDEGIETIAGAELDAGDLILAPRRLAVDETETTIDVTDCLDTPHVFINDPDDGDQSTGRETLPFRVVAGSSSHSSQSVPNVMEIGRKDSSSGLNRYIPVDEEVAWLLGLLIADGSQGKRPTLSVTEAAVLDRVLTIATGTLGCEPAVETEHDTEHVRFPAVFNDVLDHLGVTDTDADNEAFAVPDCVLRGERQIVQSFLRGYMTGGRSGNETTARSRIDLHAHSESVKDGLVFLLHRLGLVANITTHQTGEPAYTLSATREPQADSDGSEESLVVPVPDALLELREMVQNGGQLIPRKYARRDTIPATKLREIVDTLTRRELSTAAETRLERLRPLVDGDLSYLKVTDIERVNYSGYLYDLQVGGEPIFTANWLYAHNSMDAPLVMSSRIDPTEIDDEAHNVDIVSSYPVEFYEATREMADPDEVDITIAEDTLGTDDQYSGFDHTHDTSDLAAGPDLSAYKTLGSMLEKMDAQLALARKLRAVDETDVAERIIEYHFLPDLIGNLRAFARQETRCLDCNRKYRRVPLSGECRECGGRVNLTVHEGSVNKYLDTAIRVAEEFDCREYTKQRLEILKRQLESIFENDHNKPSTLGDFM